MRLIPSASAIPAMHAYFLDRESVPDVARRRLRERRQRVLVGDAELAHARGGLLLSDGGERTHHIGRRHRVEGDVADA